MNSLNKRIAVAIISGPVGKTPKDVTYSFVFDEAYRLARKGIDVDIVRSKFERGDEISYGIRFHGIERKIDARALHSLLKNIPVYPPISLLRKPTSLYWENLYATNVVKVVKRSNANLIHAHFAYPEGLVGLLAKSETTVPLIITVHGYDILTEPSVKYGIRLNRKLDFIVRKVLADADAIIVASRAAYKEALSIVQDNDKVYYVPNGVDVERFNPNIDGSHVKRRLGIEDKIVVFTLRHHEPKYGLEFLIRAAPIVLGKKKNVVFVIGGDGSLRYYHEQLTTKLGVKENIIFTGRIPREDLPYYYAMSDIVVVPSLQEAFGLVVSEAMACGKPVIGTKVGGIPDQVIDGYNGLLVQPRDPIGIAEKIIWLIENPQCARQMGLNGRKIVEEKFNANKRTDVIIGLYRHILS